MMIDLVAVWLWLFGVWPLADPGHDLSSPGGALDIGIHVVGFGTLYLRWDIVRHNTYVKVDRS